MFFAFFHHDVETFYYLNLYFGDFLSLCCDFLSCKFRFLCLFFLKVLSECFRAGEIQPHQSTKLFTLTERT